MCVVLAALDLPLPCSYVSRLRTPSSWSTNCCVGWIPTVSIMSRSSGGQVLFIAFHHIMGNNTHSTEFKDWWIGRPFHSKNPLGDTGVENPYSQLNDPGDYHFFPNFFSKLFGKLGKLGKVWKSLEKGFSKFSNFGIGNTYYFNVII